MMSNLKTGPSSTPRRKGGIQSLAVPAVCLLIAFLGYFSQWLFQRSPDLAPGPLTTRETGIFNILLVCLWWTYYKACTVDPGGYSFPSTSTSTPTTTPTRWCKKCNAPKPPRAHHCRHCRRCIARMDHHCPWTANCVSMQTFPYFLRFLVYTNLALWTLAYHVYRRLSTVWSDRHMPAYLGPSPAHLAALTIISLFCMGTCLALGILLFSTARGWVLNMTMIEDWELERHEAVLARGGGDDDTRSSFWQAADVSDGRLRGVEAVEYPYDLGVFANMAQAMGTRNPLMWFFPLAGGPVISPTGAGAGWEWEENGFNDRLGMWPPPDPDKLRRPANMGWPGAAAKVAAAAAAMGGDYETPEETKAAFARRQEADLLRRRRQTHIVAELEEQEEEEEEEEEEDDEEEDGYSDDNDNNNRHERQGPALWSNSDGDTLWDYGVDVEDEDEIIQAAPPPPPLKYEGEEDDDDVPLAELIRRRKKQS
ncbi:DHHC palmitoyltransferase-domain-containing protein [Bombardia bombarda]|uniref:Palmitoyltransferase PFA4 n=1 Tax=Bombardia bombarda TaxID=252184 RepID=A0AA40CA03_9PEZI|nr:DHHC palmitoyltransferase-domain-containing protein [Bombardia bombarda]